MLTSTTATAMARPGVVDMTLPQDTPQTLVKTPTVTSATPTIVALAQVPPVAMTSVVPIVQLSVTLKYTTRILQVLPWVALPKPTVSVPAEFSLEPTTVRAAPVSTALQQALIATVVRSPTSVRVDVRVLVIASVPTTACPTSMVSSDVQRRITSPTHPYSPVARCFKSTSGLE